MHGIMEEDLGSLFCWSLELEVMPKRDGRGRPYCGATGEMMFYLHINLRPGTTNSDVGLCYERQYRPVAVPQYEVHYSVNQPC